MKENAFYGIHPKFAKCTESSQRNRIYRSLGKQEIVDIVVETLYCDGIVVEEKELLRKSKKELVDNYFELFRDVIVEYWLPESERRN